MKTASYTLIPATTFGNANGNYDGVSEEFTGIPVKAASYYKKANSLQTASWYLNAYAGGIIIEATLEDDPETNDYFPVSPQIGNIPDAETPVDPLPTYPPISENDAFNIEGNFTWIRAKVFRFTAGAITKVSLGY